MLCIRAFAALRWMSVSVCRLQLATERSPASSFPAPGGEPSGSRRCSQVSDSDLNVMLPNPFHTSEIVQRLAYFFETVRLATAVMVSVVGKGQICSSSSVVEASFQASGGFM